MGAGCAHVNIFAGFAIPDGLFKHVLDFSDQHTSTLDVFAKRASDLFRLVPFMRRLLRLINLVHRRRHPAGTVWVRSARQKHRRRSIVAVNCDDLRATCAASLDVFLAFETYGFTVSDLRSETRHFP